MLDWWGVLKAEVTKPPAIMMGRVGMPDITRTVMNQHRNYTYLFGDNERRSGKGGQARHMRGHPNSIGVRTKAYPGREPEHYWTDDNYEENIRMIDHDIERALKTGKRIVIPSSGLGTGLSQTGERAPRTFEYLKNRLIELVGGYQGLMEHPDMAAKRRRSGEKGIRLAIVGSRHMGDPDHDSSYPMFRDRMNGWVEEHGTPEIVISGGAKGADSMAERWAAENGIPFRLHPADWNGFDHERGRPHGKSAGPVRNSHIVNDSTHAIAFLEPHSKGTQNVINAYDRTREWKAKEAEWGKVKRGSKEWSALVNRGLDQSTGKPLTIIGIHPDKAETEKDIVQDEKRGDWSAFTKLPKPVDNTPISGVDPTTLDWNEGWD